MSSACATPLPESLARAGFNLFGVLGRDRYDALVPPAWRASVIHPETRFVLVVATGGPAFFGAFAAARRAGALLLAEGAADPLDAFAGQRLGEAAQGWSDQGFPTRSLGYHERCGDPPGFADFVALGRACGLGTPSRLGLLLHPVYGPWLAIRAIWLTTRSLEPTPALVDPGPCADCPAPCTLQCPVAAPGPAGFDALRCRAERERGEPCRSRCIARHACVIGQEHAYAADAEAHHMAAALELPVVEGTG